MIGYGVVGYMIGYGDVGYIISYEDVRGCDPMSLHIVVYKSHIRTEENDQSETTGRKSPYTESTASVSCSVFRMSHWVGSVTVLFAFVMMVTSQEDFETESLDLARQAFDDQYLGCRQEMEQKLEKDNVLNIEIGKNRKLKRACKDGMAAWTERKSHLNDKLPPGFEDNHGIALLTYTGFIRGEFNNAVKRAGKSHNSYMDDFGFKWLHFYLTTALQLLRKTELYGEYTVYGGIDHDIQVPVNTYIKFGYFFFTSLDEENAAIMGNDSLIVIDKYRGVNIEKFSQYEAEREVLVPGYEVFSLSPTKEEGRFKLKTTGMYCSNINCAYIKGESSALSIQDCVTAAGCTAPSPLVTVVLVIVVNLLSHIF
ncbi:ecto-ADP-ribosyltransferase 5-like [Hyla sarda]|uniref:ecto-ADP-ribosyltransferase 5-like n=1 Tax=Hyla sarda TaxID=327740 RepID=UPI0024C22C2A|nr:ecto-ADP-ribosyltransferase 5-like [Hyla sarda]